MSHLIVDLEYICKLAFNLYKIPIYFFDNKGNLKHKISTNFTSNPLFSSNEDIIVQLFSGTNLYHFPILKESAYLEKYFSINLYSNNQFNGTIVVGPIMNFRMTEETINGIFKDLKIKVSKEEMVCYYNQLPIINNFEFINMSMVLYYIIYQQKLDLVEILKKNEQLEEKRIEIEQSDTQITERRQSNKFHTDISVERNMLHLVKMGRKDELRETFQAILKQGKIGVLSKTSYLRSQKNLGIVTITLATRASVEGGLFQEIAYNLSDLYIQKLEELNESKAVIQLTESALLDFAERVKNTKKHKYSRPINICLNYIFTHIYEDITLSHLAELTSMNPNYLSVLFKKEVGISPRRYIHQTKIDEAKHLLTYTEYTLAEISNLLNFHDQSHFIKVFKKFAGITPKQFKNGS
ncbi:helix-turn-helix domain-containing protein [Metabacillus arenae]|uniref:Helix-turn-helix domain-containing protein n=1 Tax=Metabacillus arenae TaxID=2771434 RepID=A0A926RZM7_9BACI|nr:helix-turn-helix domain-containing protein [Metabacillus arenae]MBD1382970.1 helix-turn-helix domain-containing protein [Metabacillus arenae]